MVAGNATLGGIGASKVQVSAPAYTYVYCPCRGEPLGPVYGGDLDMAIQSTGRLAERKTAIL